jgi:hypothetical protein
MNEKLTGVRFIYEEILRKYGVLSYPALYAINMFS